MKRAYLSQTVCFFFILINCSISPINGGVDQEETTQLPAFPKSATHISSLPLSEPGSFNVGVKRGLAFTDSNREGREVSLTIWYPALTDSSSDTKAITDAESDLSAAPYPMILSSTKTGNDFASHVVSYGFVWVGVDKIDSYEKWDNNVIDQPLDLLFALNQVADTAIEGLEGVIDTENVGSIGYSFDALNSLTLSGVQIDPQAYLERCANADTMADPPEDWWISYICNLSMNWDAFEDRAGSEITTGEDGLWKAVTDERIKAVMPMAPEGAWLFNKRGLASADRPVLIISAEKDTLNYYELEAVDIFENLGAPEKYMITFLDKGHMMIFTLQDVKYMKHFAVAFFGYYLQGNEDYKYFFSEDFVSQYEEFAWGVVSRE